MAILSNAQAIELIKNPKNQKELRKAVQKRVRHNLHTEPETDSSSYVLSEAHINFLSWVKSVLNSDDTYARFKSLYRPPVPTNELVESIFSQFEKVFESQNSFEHFEFTDPEATADFNEYRKALGDFSFWETQGFETLKSSVDNILIVDLPKLLVDEFGDLIQESDRPEPYYYFLDIARVIDIDNSKVKTVDSLTGKPFYFFKAEYIIFREDEGRICVFDDNTYRVYRWIDGDSEPVLESEMSHDLGYCPARSFWTTPLNSKSTILKRSPITNSVSELDWLLFYEIAAKYLKLYAPFPIYAMYKGTCKYKDEANKLKCVDGLLYPEGSKRGEFSSRPCPKCANKIKVGPGNILELKAPQEKDDPDLLSNPVKVIPAEKTSLDAVNEEIKTKKDDIFSNCVGKGVDPENKQAQNELQIQAGFESRNNVLIKIKRNFEIIQSFALETVARLRYGPEFVKLTISYGDQFFMKGESQEMEEYKIAKEQGLPDFDLNIRRDRINEARYRNNPDLLHRIEILSNLDPFPDKSATQVLEIFNKNKKLVETRDVYLKVNFLRYISRFEREQAGILQFGKALDFDVKIARISEILYEYVDEYIAGIEESTPPPPIPPPTPPPVPPPAPGAPPDEDEDDEDLPPGPGLPGEDDED